MVYRELRLAMNGVVALPRHLCPLSYTRGKVSLVDVPITLLPIGGDGSSFIRTPMGARRALLPQLYQTFVT